MIKKIDQMHALFGLDERHKCGECSNFVCRWYRSKILKKCRAYGLTHSQASDWAKRWTACGLFNLEYTGRKAIELTGRENLTVPLEGQIGLFGGEA